MESQNHCGLVWEWFGSLNFFSIFIRSQDPRSWSCWGPQNRGWSSSPYFQFGHDWAEQGSWRVSGVHSAAMLQDMALTIEYPSIQLVELSQKGLYGRGRISKHIKFRIRTYIRKEGRKEGRKEVLAAAARRRSTRTGARCRERGEESWWPKFSLYPTLPALSSAHVGFWKKN